MQEKNGLEEGKKEGREEGKKEGKIERSKGKYNSNCQRDVKKQRTNRKNNEIYKIIQRRNRKFKIKFIKKQGTFIKKPHVF